MVQVGTTLNVCDKTGVVYVRCIKVLGQSKRRIACIGDIMVVSIFRIDPTKFVKVKLFKRKKFFKGTIHRGMLIRSKQNYRRGNGLYFSFSENAVVLVNKRNIPISNRVYGPVLHELCMQSPSLGCISRYML